MEFALTDEERMIAETAASLAADHLAPHADRLDRGEGRDIFLDNLKRLADNGFMGLNIAEDYGGSAAIAYILLVIVTIVSIAFVNLIRQRTTEVA